MRYFYIYQYIFLENIIRLHKFIKKTYPSLLYMLAKKSEKIKWKRWYMMYSTRRYISQLNYLLIFFKSISLNLIFVNIINIIKLRRMKSVVNILSLEYCSSIWFDSSIMDVRMSSSFGRALFQINIWTYIYNLISEIGKWNYTKFDINWIHV